MDKREVPMLEFQWFGGFLEGWFASVVMMAIIIASARYHASWSSGPKQGIQKIHQGLVPRIGGLAILCGVWFSVLCIGSPINPLIMMSTAAASVIFMIGFAEDITASVRVLWRLILTFIPGLVLAHQSGVYLSHLGWGPADALLASNLVAILFTAFALAGVTHAFNLIDGLNGLVSYCTLWILAAYAGLGLIYEDHLILQLCLLLAAPLLGFWVFNWPWGKCFLGDGGAYFLGFSCAWIGVLLVERHPLISPFAPLLICGYPIIEALYSMLRRSMQGVSSGNPDGSHLHQLFKFALIKSWLEERSSGLLMPNSTAGLLMSVLSIPFVILALWFNADQAMLIAIFIVELLLYCLFYKRLSSKLALQKTSERQVNLAQGRSL